MDELYGSQVLGADQAVVVARMHSKLQPYRFQTHAHQSGCKSRLHIRIPPQDIVVAQLDKK